MAHESFEDQAVADYLNRHFISIKVDKEERPDVDSIYMSVCQSLTGSGGWPLTIFMMFDQKPFFAGTYFPKQSRYQMPGFLDLLKAINTKWLQDRNTLLQTSFAITQSLQKESLQGNQQQISKKVMEKAAKNLLQQFDQTYGGFGHAPKFPTPHNLMFLLRYSALEQDTKALNAVEKTLDSMYLGGIFDHIGYGFSRYSTDEKWLVPHFEKMLYDNALLVHAYIDTYQYTGKPQYREIAEMTLVYVKRELTHPEGGFYCAQDADSEGVEGKYYVFDPSEIEHVLGKEDATYFNSYFDITAGGNFEGESIPNRIKAFQSSDLSSLYKNDNTKSKLHSSISLEDNQIKKLLPRIFDYRYERTTLHKDDKILTSWNGIMIGAYAKAYKVLQNKEYLHIAQAADSFLCNHLTNRTTLFVHYRNGKASGEGHIDDYAFYSWALLELYEATLETDYLRRSLAFITKLIELFFDATNGGFYLYSSSAKSLITRPKEVYDGAIPSGNSVATYVMEKLYHLTGNPMLRQTLDKQLNFLANEVFYYPSAYCFSMLAFMQELYPTKELVCVLPTDYSRDELNEMIANHFFPQLSLLVKTDQTKDSLHQLAEFTKDYPPTKNVPFFYLCENHACLAPVHDIAKVISLL